MRQILFGIIFFPYHCQLKTAFLFLDTKYLDKI